MRPIAINRLGLVRRAEAGIFISDPYNQSHEDRSRTKSWEVGSLFRPAKSRVNLSKLRRRLQAETQIENPLLHAGVRVSEAKGNERKASS
jgi:hypothetical protein